MMTIEEEKKVPFEYQILSAAFNVPGAIERFSQELDPTTVGLIHGKTGIYEIYSALIAFHRKIPTTTVDPIAFKSWLETETSVVEGFGGGGAVEIFIDELMDVKLTTIDSMIELTKFYANKRKRLDLLQELKQLFSNQGQATDSDIEKVNKLTTEIRDLENDLRYDPLAGVRTANDIAAGIDDLWNVVPFIPTQFPSLNKALGYSETTGGILRGGITTIVALSGFGKSTLAKVMCNYWVENGMTVLFINFEEPQEHWERMLMTQLTEVNIYAEGGESSDSVRMAANDKFRRILTGWGDRFMVRHDPETLYFEDLEKWLRDVLGHGARKPDVVVIDTIQSLFTKSGGKSRWGEFEQIMVRLEKLAKDMDAAFILTAQQNINSTKESREAVNQSDMGGSVTITQKSTVVMFITPMKTVGSDDAVSETIMEVQIPKNRITGNIYTSNPPMIQYDDRIKSYIPYNPDVLDGNSNYEVQYIDLEATGITFD